MLLLWCCFAQTLYIEIVIQKSSLGCVAFCHKIYNTIPRSSWYRWFQLFFIFFAFETIIVISDSKWFFDGCNKTVSTHTSIVQQCLNKIFVNLMLSLPSLFSFPRMKSSLFPLKSGLFVMEWMCSRTLVSQMAVSPLSSESRCGLSRYRQTSTINLLFKQLYHETETTGDWSPTKTSLRSGMRSLRVRTFMHEMLYNSLVLGHFLFNSRPIWAKTCLSCFNSTFVFIHSPHQLTWLLI